MRYSKASWLAWTLCALVGVLDVVAFVMTPTDARFAAELVQFGTQFVSPIVFGVVGALIVAHQARNTIGWLLMTIALGWTIAGVVDLYQPDTIPATPTLTTLAIVWFTQWSWWVLIGPLLLILVLFPTGRPPTPRWRWVIAAVGALFGIFLFFVTFADFIQVLDSGIRLRNPLGFIPDSVMNTLFNGPWLIMLVTTVTWCVAAVFVRYRRATTQERIQIKWFLYACALFLSIYVPGGIFADDEMLWGGWFPVYSIWRFWRFPSASASRSCATASTTST